MQSGHQSEWGKAGCVPLQCGTRKGCPHSPLLSFGVLKVLTKAVREEEDISGIQVGKEEIKLSCLWMTRFSVKVPLDSSWSWEPLAQHMSCFLIGLQSSWLSLDYLAGSEISAMYGLALMLSELIQGLGTMGLYLSSSTQKHSWRKAVHTLGRS